MTGLKRTIFRHTEPQPLAVEGGNGCWGGNFDHRGLTVQFNCMGESKYSIYFQLLCFSQSSVGCAGLRVSSLAGFPHCDIAHCQKVKSLICKDLYWLCVG